MRAWTSQAPSWSMAAGCGSRMDTMMEPKVWDLSHPLLGCQKYSSAGFFPLSFIFIDFILFSFHFDFLFLFDFDRFDFDFDSDFTWLSLVLAQVPLAPPQNPTSLVLSATCSLVPHPDSFLVGLGCRGHREKVRWPGFYGLYLPYRWGSRSPRIAP